MKKRVSRLDAAFSIRDAALKKLKKEGQVGYTDFCLLSAWSGYEIYISYSTPLQMASPPSGDVLRKCYAAGVDPIFNVPYGLDIWDRQGKVLNIEWDHDNHYDLIRFKRGAWEKQVLHHL
jgi:hypothetical protein